MALLSSRYMICKVQGKLLVLFSVVYTAISYLLSSQPRDWNRFLMFLWICILVTLTSSSFGLVLGTTVNPINGTFLGAIGVAIMLVVAGFLILFNHMTPVMYSLSYISCLSYAVEGLVQSVYGYGRGPIPCPDEVEYCHYKIPDIMLRDLGMEKQNYWIDVAFLCVNFVVLRIVAFCTLKRKLAST